MSSFENNKHEVADAGRRVQDKLPPPDVGHPACESANHAITAHLVRSAEWPVIKDALTEVGVVTVELDYDGSGDIGYCQALRFNAAETEPKPWGDEPKSVAVSKEVRDQVEVLLVDCVLEEEFGGWEIDEGSYGKMTLDVGTGHIDITHWGRVLTELEETATVELESDEEGHP